MITSFDMVVTTTCRGSFADSQIRSWSSVGSWGNRCNSVSGFDPRSLRLSSLKRVPRRFFDIMKSLQVRRLTDSWMRVICFRGQIYFVLLFSVSHAAWYIQSLWSSQTYLWWEINLLLAIVELLRCDDFCLHNSVVVRIRWIIDCVLKWSHHHSCRTPRFVISQLNRCVSPISIGPNWILSRIDS